jgi:hypothetical protein
MIARVRQKHEAGRPRAFAVALKESDQLIGGGIDGINIGGSDAAELGYWLGEPYWGRGYGREAAAAIIEYGFEVLGLETIQAISDPSNAASQKVLLACGLKRRASSILLSLLVMVRCAFLATLPSAMSGMKTGPGVIRTSRNGDANVDVAPNSIGIGADFVCRLNQLFGLLLVDSCDSDCECGGEHEAARVVATETNLSNDFDVFVGKS